MSIIQKLTEGIVSRSVRKEGEALLDKWERTGLLEGLTRDREKENMARLLENQAKQLLKEVNTMQSGAVEGFAAVAFPIVRRVFAGLIANDIVSVQPMSLPSGLIFFLDFTFGDDKENVGAADGDSIFGGGIVGSQLTTGATLDTDTVEKSFYSLNSGYASPTELLALRGLLMVRLSPQAKFAMSAGPMALLLLLLRQVAIFLMVLTRKMSVMTLTSLTTPQMCTSWHKFS